MQEVSELRFEAFLLENPPSHRSWVKKIHIHIREHDKLFFWSFFLLADEGGFCHCPGITSGTSMRMRSHENVDTPDTKQEDLLCP